MRLDLWQIRLLPESVPDMTQNFPGLRHLPWPPDLETVVLVSAPHNRVRQTPEAPGQAIGAHRAEHSAGQEYGDGHRRWLKRRDQPDEDTRRQGESKQYRHYKHQQHEQDGVVAQPPPPFQKHA